MEKGIFRRDFNLLIVANFISQLGDWLAHLVIVHFIGEVAPGSFFAFSKASIFVALPVIIFGPFSSVFVDRTYKKHLMLLGDMVRFLLVFFLPYILGITNLNVIWGVIFLVFTFNLIFNSSRYSIIPDIVGVKNSIYANSTLAIFSKIAAVIGTIAGGFIVQKIGWRYGFKIDGITFLLSFLLILFLKEKGVKKRGKVNFNSYFLDLKEGFLYTIKDKTIMFVMISYYIMMFISSLGYGVIIKAIQQDLGMGTAGVSISGGFMYGGMMIGALFVGLKGKYNRSLFITFAFLLTSIALFVAPMLFNFIVICFVMFLAGSMISLISVSLETLIHENVKSTIRGRIFTFKDVMSSISFVFNSIVVGLLADKFGLKFIMTISAIFVVVASLFNFSLLKIKRDGVNVVEKL